MFPATYVEILPGFEISAKDNLSHPCTVTCTFTVYNFASEMCSLDKIGMNISMPPMRCARDKEGMNMNAPDAGIPASGESEWWRHHNKNQNGSHSAILPQNDEESIVPNNTHKDSP